ncbi:hypothetical protein BO70DRAFT_366174 [Aspergillus heteromorphus CBS 117.55]|uniref:Uncharacterized protein n=1 Tax=Aspergillus heteromorphus CBS 117.55 TaxID=1448321 RepID=A0A317V1E0_9EURO|nr:uncharacterized protein BO70DRAFT_366174 [Aspergillus heteromorphus CBS 117.55]PWY67875.1 hypothetical protein BO70DRAFT_366174 [Aspergillus heteromorphus CBS 117.55]
MCQRLLLLGARWFNSEDRYNFIQILEDKEGAYPSRMKNWRVTAATRMERRWVRVGWPSRGPGFWIAEFDADWERYDKHAVKDEPIVPDEATQVLLARTMDERCEILKRMGGRFFASLEEYKYGGGAACLTAWETKLKGEVGPLIQTPLEEEKEEKEEVQQGEEQVVVVVE